MRPWKWPRPRYDLGQAPEMAAVDALGIVVEIAVATLRAACPALREPRLPPWAPPRVRMAQSVLTHAEALRLAVERYRETVGYEIDLDDDDDDLSF